jgi:hypothetical protein
MYSIARTAGFPARGEPDSSKILETSIVRKFWQADFAKKEFEFLMG